MKTREQNRNNKRTEIERFDWFIERIQTRVACVWLSERAGEKTSRPRNFYSTNRPQFLKVYTLIDHRNDVIKCSKLK